MTIYIRSAACISPFSPFGGPPAEYGPARLKCIEPDYKALLDPRLLRRMSRIVRMGSAAALSCLKEAAVAEPDAIVTGTAYGCLEDTGIFLTSLIERNEETLQPAAFIQSTHNTVGAQIALLLQCTGYNNTFVHRGLSFESALQDAILLLQEGDAATVLAGGIDELTDTSHALLSRFGLYRHTRAGEGAAFFLLTAGPSQNDWARVEGLTTFYKPEDGSAIAGHIRSFLSAHDRPIDLVITGASGDRTGDAVYERLTSGDGPLAGLPLMTYKDLCGEYPTSTAFACWLAARLIRQGERRRILIYNHYLGIHHSLILVSATDAE